MWQPRMATETPLLHLASHDGEVEVARMLIRHSADVATQNNNGDTPLHVASSRGQVEVTRMLIEHGAHVTAQNKDRDRETPLHQVSSVRMCFTPPERQVEVAFILIEHGADVTAQNEYGEAPVASGVT
jgi:hypothetical protein